MGFIALIAISCSNFTDDSDVHYASLSEPCAIGFVDIGRGFCTDGTGTTSATMQIQALLDQATEDLSRGMSVEINLPAGNTVGWRKYYKQLDGRYASRDSGTTKIQTSFL